MISVEDRIPSRDAVLKQRQLDSELAVNSVLSAWAAATVDERSLDDIDSVSQKLGFAFVDVDFPPSEQSLYGKKVDDTSQKHIWLQPGQIFGDTVPTLFGDGIDPADIVQGTLGNCYFLTALSVLARYPDRILSLFVTRSLRRDGACRVRFYRDSQWTEVTVDSYLPCVLATQAPAYSRPVQGKLWVALLEKAYAKLCGSYERTRGGNVSEALADLTGMPVEDLCVL